MVDFGYGTVKANNFDLDTAKTELASYLAAHEPSFNLCIACGACAATCTAAKFTNFSFRSLTHQIRRGEEESSIKEAAKCMLCGKCTLVCPRNVNTRNIIVLIRENVQTIHR
ncbi:MAG TPA: 4Fe-4S dicluster domain-containing protein [Williamwhitmania sp.]|nr:4Fe-4S dicluster domain-containing protein [Williamwhitmania sp.]